jgi:hypothetical protein
MFANSVRIACRLSIVAFLFALVPLAGAAELRTYEFVAGQDRLFSYSGGLVGVHVEAQLTGSFDVEIEADGTSQLTRFDVQLADVVDTGLYAVGWMNGEHLADKLFVDPVGLTGHFDGDWITLGLPTNPIPEENTPNTIIRVKDLGGGQAEVLISSLPHPIFDNPSMNTELPGLLARVVPEPASWVLVAGMAVLGGASRRRRRFAAR